MGLIVVFILYSIWLVKRDPGLGDRVGSIVPMTDTAVRPTRRPEVPAHPLDPATGAEYLVGREIMAKAELLAEPVSVRLLRAG